MPFAISTFTDIDKNFLQMFNFEHTKLKQTQFEQLAKLLKTYKYFYGTSKLGVGKIKVELNLPLKETAYLKNKELPV